MDKGAPIGVFDSGIGGLTVLEEIQQLLPHESLLYVADCGHIPYGEKSPATVAAVADLRLDFPDWPLVGMEPAVKPAAAATRSGVVGVLATTGTLQSAKFAALLDRFATDVKVITQPCPGLVELIESGDLTSTALRQLLQGYIEPLLSAGCDTIILGCTHYPFLKPLLAQMLPPSIILIDTGAAVARQLKRLLGERDLLAAGNPEPAQFWTSGDVYHLRNILPTLWKYPGVVRSFAS
jgi:glutamate racemase